MLRQPTEVQATVKDQLKDSLLDFTGSTVDFIQEQDTPIPAASIEALESKSLHDVEGVFLGDGPVIRGSEECVTFDVEGHTLEVAHIDLTATEVKQWDV